MTISKKWKGLCLFVLALQLAAMFYFFFNKDYGFLNLIVIISIAINIYLITNMDRK